MATTPQPSANDQFNQRWLTFVRAPWIDRAIALVAVIPFAWLTYIRMRTLGFDVPRLALALQGLILIGTMVTRKLPVRISTNLWVWLLTFVETYWIVLIFALLAPGLPLVPYWLSATLATLGASLMIWARLSLGRSIGLVPALRSLVTRGAYSYVRHPIYTGGALVFIASVLHAYSPLNLAMVTFGIFWFVLKSLAEESFLKSDPSYTDYMLRVPWRWIPGIV